MRSTRRDLRNDPRNLLTVALTFMVLSAGTAVWHWARGEPVGPGELGFFTGALIILGVGLYLGHVRRGWFRKRPS